MLKRPFEILESSAYELTKDHGEHHVEKEPVAHDSDCSSCDRDALCPGNSEIEIRQVSKKVRQPDEDGGYEEEEKDHRFGHTTLRFGLVFEKLLLVLLEFVHFSGVPFPLSFAHLCLECFCLLLRFPYCDPIGEEIGEKTGEKSHKNT